MNIQLDEGSISVEGTGDIKTIRLDPNAIEVGISSTAPSKVFLHDNTIILHDGGVVAYIDTRVDSSTSALSSEIDAVALATGTVSATVDDNYAEYTSTTEAQATVNSSTTTRIDTLETENNGYASSITALDTVTSGMFTIWDGVSDPATGNIKFISDIQYQYIADQGWVRTDQSIKVVVDQVQITITQNSDQQIADNTARVEELNDIASDLRLEEGEKVGLRRELTTIINHYAIIDGYESSYGINIDVYRAAYTTLHDYIWPKLYTTVDVLNTATIDIVMATGESVVTELEKVFTDYYIAEVDVNVAVTSAVETIANNSQISASRVARLVSSTFLSGTVPTGYEQGDIWTATDDWYDVEHNYPKVRLHGEFAWEATIPTIAEVRELNFPWVGGSSKLLQGLDGNITGWQFSDGSNLPSSFTINADVFKISNAANSHTPFTIDASTGLSTFNGVVDFTNTNVEYGYPGTTSINGGLLTTDSVVADKINTAGLIVQEISDGTASPDFEIKADGTAGPGSDANIYGSVIRGSTLTVDNILNASIPVDVGFASVDPVMTAINIDITDAVGGNIPVGAYCEGDSHGLVAKCVGTASSYSAIYGYSQNGIGVEGYSDDDAAAAIRAYSDNSGGAISAYCDLGNAGWFGTGLASSEWGVFTYDKVYAEAGYLPFTGAHKGFMIATDVMIGDILTVTSSIGVNVSQTYQYMDVSNAADDSTVLGVFEGTVTPLFKFMATTQAFGEFGYSDELRTHTYSGSIRDEYLEMYDILLAQDYSGVTVNALGEGMINVCSSNGDLMLGDYITSSAIRGKGAKQSDDLLRSSTVAKCMEDVNWDLLVIGEDGCYASFDSIGTEYKTLMVSCTYHCG